MSDGRSRLSPLFTWRSAICDSDLPSTTRHLALTLSLHMSERGDSAFPSVGLLVEETGLGRRTVQRHLRKLEEEGWIEEDGWTTYRSAGGQQKVKRYRALVPFSTDVSQGGVRVTPPEGKGASLSTQGGVTESKGGVTVTPKDDKRASGGRGARTREAQRREDWNIVLQKSKNRRLEILCDLSRAGQQALEAIGGMDALRDLRGKEVRFVRRDFMDAYPEQEQATVG